MPPALAFPRPYFRAALGAALLAHAAALLLARGFGRAGHAAVGGAAAARWEARRVWGYAEAWDVCRAQEGGDVAMDAGAGLQV